MLDQPHAVGRCARVDHRDAPAVALRDIAVEACEAHLPVRRRQRAVDQPVVQRLAAFAPREARRLDVAGTDRLRSAVPARVPERHAAIDERALRDRDRFARATGRGAARRTGASPAARARRGRPPRTARARAVSRRVRTATGGRAVWTGAVATGWVASSTASSTASSAAAAWGAACAPRCAHRPAGRRGVRPAARCTTSTDERQREVPITIARSSAMPGAAVTNNGIDISTRSKPKWNSIPGTSP